MMKNIYIISLLLLCIFTSCDPPTTEKVYIINSDRCNKCNGVGKKIIKCNHCKGSGTQWSRYDNGDGERIDCIECVNTFCDHDTRSHEQDEISFSSNCARYKENGAEVGEIYGSCPACDGKGRIE